MRKIFLIMSNITLIGDDFMLKILHLFIERRLIVFLSIFLLFIPFNIISSEGKDGKANHSLDINATSVGLNFSTFFGGNKTDEGYSIAVALDGCCYVTGTTSSDNFPTKNAYNSTFGGGGSDAFVAKFETNGSLLWSTYLGGSEWDQGLDIAVTSDGSCYVTGSTQSNDFPIAHAYDSALASLYDDVFITKFSYNGSLLWSTFLGGSHIDMAYGIAITNNSKCFVSGKTYSSDFPTLNAYDNTLNGIDDAFITKFAELVDNIAPTISEPSHYPLSPLDNETVTILADVTDSNGVFNVTVYYRVNSEP